MHASEPGYHIQAYNRWLYQHTVQTAMLGWLENLQPRAALEETTDASHIWAQIIERHFDENARDIKAQVERWIREPIQDTPGSWVRRTSPVSIQPRSRWRWTGRVPPEVIDTEPIPEPRAGLPGETQSSAVGAYETMHAGLSAQESLEAHANSQDTTAARKLPPIGNFALGAKSHAWPPSSTSDGTRGQVRGSGGGRPPAMARSELIEFLRSALPKLRERGGGGGSYPFRSN